jgi:hypothetical protein
MSEMIKMDYDKSVKWLKKIPVVYNRLCNQ